MLVRMRSKRNSHSLLVEMQNGTEDRSAFSYKTKTIHLSSYIILPSNQSLLGIYPNVLKTYDHTKTCTRIFIVALSIMVKA